MKRVVLFLGVLTALAACRGKIKKEGATEKKVYRFEQVTVPIAYTDPHDIVAFLTKNYWNNFDFTDTAYIHLPEITEQAFADYLQVIFNAEPAAAIGSIQAMLGKAEKTPEVFNYFLELYEKYLDDPNSPMRNDELYVPVLELLLASPQLSEDEKIRPQYRWEMLMRNKVGDPATDFSFELIDGKRMKMYDIRAEYLLLFINNPDCPACKEYREMLLASPLTSGLLQDGKLKVLMIYPDENVAAWEKHAHNIPADWYNGRDHDLLMKKNDLYDLRAIPSLYLLDKDKKVLLRDASFPQIEYVLSTLMN